MTKLPQFTLIAALLIAPAAAAAETAPATAETAATPTLEVPQAGDETRLRQQLEQVRALNAQLRSEREALQRQVDEMEAKVAVENKRLGIKPSPIAAPAAAAAETPWAFYGGVLLGVALVFAGALHYRRRRRAG